MKKLLFQKFLKDTTETFIIISISIGLIVWVMQAVSFLDFITEDGHGLYVYFYYTGLNFPKIVHRILPFVFFISLFYQISQYEQKNELLIFWTHGVNKINFLNILIIYSFIVLLFQIFLGSYLSPISQNKAKSFIRNSNIDFFPNLIKEGKFIDTVSGLTIFIGAKDERGNYKNIFLNDNVGNVMDDRSQVIYAKKGFLVDSNNNRYFKLTDGKMINNEKGKVTNFTFDTINFNLNRYESKTTTYPKIQESSNKDLISCLYYKHKNQLSKFKAEFLDCNDSILGNIKQELLKRFYKPIYIPLIALICGALICVSKENINYTKFKFFLFIFLTFIVVISEISLRYTSSNNMGFLFFIFLPIGSFLIIYTILFKKLKI